MNDQNYPVYRNTHKTDKEVNTKVKDSHSCGIISLLMIIRCV